MFARFLKRTVMVSVKCCDHFVRMVSSPGYVKTRISQNGLKTCWILWKRVKKELIKRRREVEEEESASHV